ncbi:hypothetical protein ACT3SQ_00175 [Brachybacterium sp. AOP42-C2-15]|uniref:hypothetical protein n=1 Tax=Brachybacterium sp. AOP42-C2-15 TaxID=3457670 RepID=UPI004034CB1B
MSIVRTAVGIASTCYAANAALGLSVAAGLIDTSGARWVRHGLFIATASTTGLALALGAVRRDPSAVALGAAVIPLVLLQRQGARPLARHARTAALAAPCFAAALLLTRR